MTYHRREIEPPPGGELTKNEHACLDALRQEGPDMALTTVQLASMAGLHTSSVIVACTRLVKRNRIQRHEPRSSLERVRWSLLAARSRVA